MYKNLFEFMKLLYFNDELPQNKNFSLINHKEKIIKIQNDTNEFQYLNYSEFFEIIFMNSKNEFKKFSQENDLTYYKNFLLSIDEILSFYDKWFNFKNQNDKKRFFIFNKLFIQLIKNNFYYLCKINDIEI